jgi:hypothetical protein
VDIQLPIPTQPEGTPLLEGGYVVTKAAVGFGPPDRVTVGAPDTGEAKLPLLAAEESTIANWEDIAYMTPCVELMKIM